MAAEWRRWLLRSAVRALPCRQFEIKLVTQPTDGTHGRCIKTLMLTPDELISEWRQFGRWSAQRLNVFMRPVGGPVHVLLDLDTPGVLDEVLNIMAFDGSVPSLVVETSPGHAHLWCSLTGREQPTDVHRAASKLLAERYCGDPGSAKPSQPGRVPGTMNPKPSRAMTDGAPPLVLVKRAQFTPSARLLADARQQAEQDTHSAAEDVKLHFIEHPDREDATAEVAAMLAEAMKQHDGDRSAADFEVACVMLRAGDPPEHVAAMLIATSEKAHERETRRTGSGVHYAEQTVRGAMRAVGARPSEKADFG